MKVDMTYPVPPKKQRWFERLRSIMRWVFVSAAIVCPVVNIWIGGKAWCVVVLWAMWSVWKAFLSPDMVELNLISQTVKALLYSVILLALIDMCLASGWALFVIPIVSFGALIVTAVFFFSDMNRQRQNTMPMIWLTLFSLVAFVASFSGWPVMNWPMMVLGGVALFLSCIGLIAFRKALLLELKKRFHIK